jgi:type VI secretion system protein ImpK
MSDRDRPFDPFGRNDRTIIRPNPGGRRSAPAGAAPPAPPVAPVSPGSPPPEDWVRGPARSAPPPRGPAAVLVPRKPPDTPSHNPMMGAAGPLLLLLGRFRAGLVQAPSAPLMEQVAQAIEEFEREVRAANMPPEQVRAAKYVVSATADDIVQNMPVQDRHIWTQYSMLSRFFGERTGGVRFFEELDRARADPIVNYPLLELMHACVALGFEGIHRTSAGGAAMLQQIQRGLYDTLRRVRPKVTEEISPHWRGQDIAARVAGFRIPVWAVASVVAFLLFAVFITLRALLGSRSDVVATALLGLFPDTAVAIQRAAPVPPPPPPIPVKITQLQRIRAALAPEIAAGKLNADQTASDIIITVGNVSLFQTGQTEVLDSFKPIAARIADTLEKEPGFIKVTGHTDNTPIKTVRFPSNYDLSVERAKSVAALLRTRLSHPERLQTAGKGADSPVASNKTPEGRARNRRVEIMIPRED